MIQPEPKPPVRPSSSGGSPLGGTPGTSGKPVGPINPPSPALDVDLISELDLQANNENGLPVTDGRSGVIFEYTDGNGTHTLKLRLDPYEVGWTYNVITNVVDTYGGQVVQVLGINIGTLTIKGRFGKETPWGAVVENGIRKPLGELKDSNIWDYEAASGPYGVGLTQMTTFFREYFAVSTQGQDAQTGPGHYVQIPMILRYPNRQWLITPFEFPSYRRSKEDFAPEWMVNAYVIERADNDNIPPTKPPTLDSLHIKDMAKALDRINSIIGYPDKERNPWSDPLPGNKFPNSAEAERAALKMVHMYKDMLPPYTLGDVKKMLWQDISVPTVFDFAGINTNPDDPGGNSNVLPGETPVMPGDVVGGTPPGTTPSR